MLLVKTKFFYYRVKPNKIRIPENLIVIFNQDLGVVKQKLNFFLMPF